MEDIKDLSLPKVAIIGAGPAGILWIKHWKDVADVTCFESKSDIGGIWRYTDITEYNHPDLQNDSFYNLYGCLHSSMYFDLWTNLPKYLMTFKDFPHDEATPHIISHSKFLEYLNAYWDQFDLKKNIKFDQTVTSVTINKDGSPHKFQIKSQWTTMDENSVESISNFDYILVCNGQYAHTKIPQFPGSSTFTGTQLHIHNFRKFSVSDFEGKNLLIVGSSFSAHDILHHLFFRTSQVHPHKVIVASHSVASYTDSALYQPFLADGSLVAKTGNVAKIEQDLVYSCYVTFV